jgi:3-hydroxyisobutyrate dehydrogenase-like beta-hydroxyacid dehydrogenase
MKIGFIGFGEAARAFQESLAGCDSGLAFAAYDILLDSEGLDGASAQAMRERSVAIAQPPQAGLNDADWIFSAVTADQSLEAANAAARYLRPGQVFFDINSVSPERKRESAGTVETAGARYIDMAVMAPVHPKGHQTATLLAGDLDTPLRQKLADLGFAFDIVADEPGAATAIKMVRSLFVKGLEAITVEALLAASASGCLDQVLGSLNASFPGLDWPTFAHYQFERTLRHGARRAAEMHESATTVDALQLHGALATAIAEVHDRMGALPRQSFEGSDLASELAELVALRRAQSR